MENIFTVDQIPFAPNYVTLVSGYFDLLHPGHAQFLNVCKEIGNPLVVGVYSDELTARKNSERPIIAEADRLIMVASLKCVDYSFIQRYHVLDNNGYILNEIQPKVIVYSSGESNSETKDKELSYVEVNYPNIKVQTVSRQRSDISTTQLIEKIKSKNW